MIDRSRSFDTVAALLLAGGLAATFGPLYLALCTASHDAVYLSRHRAPLILGYHLAANLEAAWVQANLGRKLLNSFVVSLLVTAVKLILATTTAFAMVFFRTPLRTVGLAAILVTLMLPLEARIAPTYAVAADAFSWLDTIMSLFSLRSPLQWTLLDTYAGLSLPLMAGATGVLLFRQVFLALPPELVEASKMDGAGPLRFLVDMVLPLSGGNVAALAAVTFISAWNQYLWPLLITTKPQMQTAVLALTALMPDPQDPAPAWNLTLAGLIIVVAPPLLVAAGCQRWLVRGLTRAAVSA